MGRSPHMKNPTWKPPSDSLTLQTTTVQNPMLSLISYPGTPLEEPHLDNRSASFLKLQGIGYKTSLVAQMVKHLPTMWETWVRFLGQEDPLEKETALLPRKSHGQRSLYLGWQRVSNQCKEIEENDTMRKTRDLFKKIRDTKGIFHEKMGLIKDRNGMDLTSL